MAMTRPVIDSGRVIDELVARYVEKVVVGENGFEVRFKAGGVNVLCLSGGISHFGRRFFIFGFKIKHTCAICPNHSHILCQFLVFTIRITFFNIGSWENGFTTEKCTRRTKSLSAGVRSVLSHVHWLFLTLILVTGRTALRLRNSLY